MTTLFTFFKVSCQFDWEYEIDQNSSSEYSFATLDGAKEWVASKNNLRWYSIEGLEAFPCDESNPGGQLYYGMIHMEFHDLTKCA